MKRILTEALAVANATSRSLLLRPRAAEWFYYFGSAWLNPLFISGYQFETPIPMITREGVKPFPPTGYRTLDAQSAFFYGITGITPAMSMRLPGIVSQYLFATQDASKQYFDGAKTGDAAEGHPGGEILVLHGLRQPDAIDAGHAARLPARRQPELSVARRRTAPTAPRRCTSVRGRPTASSGATGSRRRPTRAGS